MPPGSDDDPGSRPHPGPSDRPWFHPSELPLDAGAHPPRRRRSAVPVLAGLISAAMAAGFVAFFYDAGAGDAGGPSGQAGTAARGAGPTFVLPASDHDGRSVDPLVEATVVEVVAWDGPKIRYGSGVAYGGDGVVVTAAAVVAGAATVEVRYGGDQAAAEVVGTDPQNDLAVLRVPLRLEPTRLARSTTFDPGDDCFVVGVGGRAGQIVVLAGGVAHTRVVQPVAEWWLVDAIEFEAPTGSAAAGGALVDSDGAVAGIVISIRSERGGRPLAVPARTVVRSVGALLVDGEVEHPWLGVAVQDAAPGPAIVGVHPDGPARRAGLGEGDVVVAIEGREISDSEGLMRAVRSLTVGTTVVVAVDRDGTVGEYEVTVGARS